MGLMFLQLSIHHLNWYFKYWIGKMKLFWLIFNTESVPWWRTCLDFKHLEEAFGYFRSMYFNQPTYSHFWKAIYNWRTGEIGFDHNPNCHSVFSLLWQTGIYTISLSSYSQCYFKTSKVISGTKVGFFFHKGINLKCPFSVLHLIMTLSLPLPVSFHSS